LKSFFLLFFSLFSKESKLQQFHRHHLFISNIHQWLEWQIIWDEILSQSGCPLMFGGCCLHFMCFSVDQCPSTDFWIFLQPFHFATRLINPPKKRNLWVWIVMLLPDG
jgi:hypothetical protein